MSDAADWLRALAQPIPRSSLDDDDDDATRLSLAEATPSAVAASGFGPICALPRSLARLMTNCVNHHRVSALSFFSFFFELAAAAAAWASIFLARVASMIDCRRPREY